MTFDNIFKSSRDNQTVVCLYDCNYCTHSINFFKLTNVVSCNRQPLPSKYFAPISIGSASRDSIPATVKNRSSVEQ